MRRPSIRFSLKILLVAVTVVGIALALAVYPTLRARQFVQLVQSGEQQAAEQMFSHTLEPNDPYLQVLRSARQAKLEPLSLSQIIHGKRQVIVGQGWGGGKVEFLVSYRSIRHGRSWLHTW